jgi:TadE-like protein
MSVQRHPIRRTQSGQALAEFGVVLPLLLLLVLGVIEFGYAIYRSLLIDALAREGSNLISRHTTLTDTETALRSAAPAAVPLDSNGCVILSVIKLGTGGANINRPIVYQRYRFGSLSATSVLGSQPTGSYGPGPDYVARNADDDSSIRIAGALPNGLTLSPGNSVFVTEVVVNHRAVSPLARFGVSLPTTLYASAYF